MDYDTDIFTVCFVLGKVILITKIKIKDPVFDSDYQGREDYAANYHTWAVETAKQWLLFQDPSSIQSTHMATHSCLLTPVPRDPMNKNQYHTC